jgi:hypothetical protein
MDIQINIYFKKVNFASFPFESSVSSAEGCHGNEPLTDLNAQTSTLDS